MLLIVGWDGASWDVIEPMLRQGRLPNVARLCRQGARGVLQSTMPPITFPSWTTFMTGVNPGKHGIFDFTRRVPGTYQVQFVNGTFRKAPTIWRLLGEAGRRVAVLGLPGTYPPEPINGCMVSGFDTPVTTRADRSFVWPSEFYEDVQAVGGFPFADFQEFQIGDGWHEQALQSLHEGIAKKSALASRLLQREPWDCLLVLFGETDTVAHHFWGDHDPGSPHSRDERRVRFGDAVNSIYESLDRALGSLMEIVPDANVILVSDHGFGGTGGKTVHLNAWLAQLGLLGMSEPTPARRFAGVAKSWALRAIPPAWQRRVFNLGGNRWANRIESSTRFSGIDWARTQAFSEELNYFPSIWLNVRGRDPRGQVDPADTERLREEIALAAARLVDPESGEAIIRRVWRREELYEGPWTHLAPDLILEYNLDDGYSYVTASSSRQSPSSPVIEKCDVRFGGGKLHGMSGSHRRDGVLIMAGPGIDGALELEDCRMVDVAPTILTLCEVLPTKEMDGRNLLSSVDRSCSALSRSYRFDSEWAYGVEEEAEIAQRLSDLGYLG